MASADSKVDVAAERAQRKEAAQRRLAANRASLAAAAADAPAAPAPAAAADAAGERANEDGAQAVRWLASRLMSRRLTLRRVQDGAAGDGFRPEQPVYSFVTGRMVPPAVFGLNVPPGWHECPPFGAPIRGFVPSKVPLCRRYVDRLPPELRYGPAEAVALLAAQGIAIGYVIDLTYTSRYTDVREWADLGITYTKVACRGRDGPPEPDAVNEFVWAATAFFRDGAAADAAAAAAGTPNPHPRHILVHCTHGFNRTGAMVAHYLMREMPTPPAPGAPSPPYCTVETAVATIARARPPGIYKEDYLAQLWGYYHEARPLTAACPPLPAWKARDPTDGDDDGDPPPGSGDAFTSGDPIYAATPVVSPYPPPWATEEPPVYVPPSATAAGEGAMHHEDVVGEAVPGGEATDLGSKLCALVHGAAPPGGRDPYFPGSQPVSLDSSNLCLLGSQRYLVTWKADGTRYLLLLLRGGGYLVNRDMVFRRCQMRFPGGDKVPHHGTVLDGEMVIDWDAGAGTATRRFLAYDLLALGGEAITGMPFAQRWKLLEDRVIAPKAEASRRAAAEPHRYAYRYDAEPFKLRRKAFYPLSAAMSSKLLTMAFSHATDGLIFQPADTGYTPGTTEDLLKWKPGHMNSVDFVLRLPQGGGSPRLFVTGVGPTGTTVLISPPGPTPVLHLPLPGGVDIQSLDGKVVECSRLESGEWEVMRERRDRGTPNHERTYTRLLRSIADNIGEDDLLAALAQLDAAKPAGPPTAGVKRERGQGV